MAKRAPEHLKPLTWKWPRAALFVPLALAAVISGGPVVRADEIKIGGTGAALGSMAKLVDAYQQTEGNARIAVVPNLGSTGGIKAVLSGAIQLAVASRPLRERERSAGAKSLTYARTPFIFVTSKETQGVAAVTLRQLADIYSGKTKQWADGTRVRIVLRPEGDSDTTLLRSLSPALREAEMAARNRPGLLNGATDHDAVSMVEKLPGTLGTSTLAMIESERHAVKALKLDGVEPSVRNLADGSYRWFKTLRFVVTQNTPPSVHKFIAFVRSPAGRAILIRNGNAPD